MKFILLIVLLLGVISSNSVDNSYTALPKHLVELDGVLYADTTKRKETMRGIFTQDVSHLGSNHLLFHSSSITSRKTLSINFFKRSQK
jgi:hypothetical protein